MRDRSSGGQEKRSPTPVSQSLSPPIEAGWSAFVSPCPALFAPGGPVYRCSSCPATLSFLPEGPSVLSLEENPISFVAKNQRFLPGALLPYGARTHTLCRLTRPGIPGRGKQRSAFR